MENVYYIYKFEDGTVLTLVNNGFSTAELWKMQDLHGKCQIETKSQ